jgi:hypothetical protein
MLLLLLLLLLLLPGWKLTVMAGLPLGPSFSSQLT